MSQPYLVLEIMIVLMRKIGESKMTVKSKIAIFVAIAAAIVVTVPLIVNQEYSAKETNKASSEQVKQIGSEPKNVPPPVNLPRTGVTFLVAYPLAIQPANAHEVSVNDYAWLARTISKGETNVSEQELNEYFNMTGDFNYFFRVISLDGTAKYYSVEYEEIPISLEAHNIKAYRLEVTPDTYIPVSLQSHSWLKAAVDNEFRWIIIDGQSAMALKQLTNNEHFNFRVVYEDGHSEFYNIRYAGPGLDTVGEP